MAGGIFTKRPFEPNLKCIVFALAIVSLYWFSPTHKNKWLLVPLFITSYVALAWYDYAYDCSPKMKSGQFPVGLAMADSIFKPQYRRDNDDAVSDTTSESGEQERLYRRNVYLFHVLIVVPPLLYVGFAERPNRDVLRVVGTLGLGALAYHGYRIFQPRRGC